MSERERRGQKWRGKRRGREGGRSGEGRGEGEKGAKVEREEERERRGQKWRGKRRWMSIVKSEGAMSITLTVQNQQSLRPPPQRDVCAQECYVQLGHDERSY